MGRESRKPTAAGSGGAFGWTARAGLASCGRPSANASGGGEYSPSYAGRQTEELVHRPWIKKRITPRSPRAALEPEQVAVPTRRSGRARNPFVIAGNAVFTLLILLVLGGGCGVRGGQGPLRGSGPLDEDKVVNIPPRLGLMEIAETLRREGVMSEKQRDLHR